MSLYILDTDILTLYQHGHAGVIREVQTRPLVQLAASIITVEEELTGWYTKLRRARKRDQLARVYQRLTDFIRFVSRLQILSLTEAAIIRYEGLRRSHRHISKNDLRIAAIVLELGATLVSRNLRDFQQIPGLTIEDWAK